MIFFVVMNVATGMGRVVRGFAAKAAGFEIYFYGTRSIGADNAEQGSKHNRDSARKTCELGSRLYP